MVKVSWAAIGRSCNTVCVAAANTPFVPTDDSGQGLGCEPPSVKRREGEAGFFAKYSCPRIFPPHSLETGIRLQYSGAGI